MQILSDAEILELFLQRDQQAIAAMQQKYGSLCLHMAENLTGSREDAEECLSDALMSLWENIPPEAPEHPGGWLMTVCRRKALDRRRHIRREKRGGGHAEAALEELAECLASPERTEDQVDGKALSEAIGSFLETQSPEARTMFILRYWSCLSAQEIAAECGCAAGTVRVTLMRTRNKLHKYLEQGGYL